MSCFLEILRCILCCEEDGIERREDLRYQVPSGSSCSSPSHFEQRSPAIPSVQRPRYINKRDHWNQITTSSVRVEATRETLPKQPRVTPISPIRFVSPTPSPSVLQTNFIDSTGAPPLSLPPKKPSAPSGSVSLKIPSSSPYSSDPPKKPSAPSVLDPPKKPSAPTGLDLPKKPSPTFGSDPPNKPSALYGLDPPKNPFAPSGSYPPRKPPAPSCSDPPKKPSASSGPHPPKKPSGPSGFDSHKMQPGLPNWRTGSTLPVYQIPEDIMYLLKKDRVPEVLKKPLSPSTYTDYFAALLYAEDYYEEKWNGFLLSKVTLRLHEETTSEKVRNNSKTACIKQRGKIESDKEEKKVYVAFEIDSIPERRPYLLSRDFVYIRNSGKDVEPFEGRLSRVIKSKTVLAEFGKDFHSQYSSRCMYDVSFSFNRICLKRHHQAVAAAVDPSFHSILFPERVSRSIRPIATFVIPFNQNFDKEEMSAVYQILSLKGPPPYLIVHDLSHKIAIPSRVQKVINQAILQIYRTFSDSRILIAAPQNRTCDLLMSGLKKEIPDSEMFRVNAAFREREDVPDDILSYSLYEGECFTCPPSQDLRKYKVIMSTFMSSFRLCNHGIYAGHFSHIFLVDACSATEPETMVTLANLANESTAVVLTGSYAKYPEWVRSDIARANGLKRSYFRRLLDIEPYSSCDPVFVKHL